MVALDESSTRPLSWRIFLRMCRNIRVLHNFQPPSTPDEIRAAALQFVRKVSGLQKPGAADQQAFERAIEEVTKTTTTLLESLVARSTIRTREGEREKAKAKWALRATRIRSTDAT